MTKPLALDLLLLEDSPADAELVVAELRSSGFDVQWERVDSELDYLRRLADPPDVIIADFSLPGFNALEALAIRPESTHRIPFIIVTGTVSEEVAVQCIKEGASDYVLKDRLSRLPLAVEAALENARVRESRERALAELAETQRRYRRLFLEARTGIFVTAADGTIIDCNPAFASIFGFEDPKSALGTSVEGLYAQPASRRELLDVVRSRGRVDDFEVEAVRRDGERLDVLLSCVGEVDDSGELVRIAGYLTDVTGQRHAERRRDLLAAAVEASAETVMITDPDGVLQYVNPAFTEMSGIEADDAIGKTPKILKSGLHDDEFYTEMWRVLKRAENFSAKFTNRRADGSLYYVEGTISPVTDPRTGAMTNFVAIQRDVTFEMSLQSQVEAAERLNALGRLAGGVAHDFNNMLTVIQASSDFIRSQIGDELGDLRTEVDEIRHASEQAAELTRQLLAFGRRQTLRPQRVDLNQVAEDVRRMLRRILPEHIQVRLDLDETVPPVHVDPRQMEHVLVNLAVNARDAMPDGGVLTLATTSVAFSDVVESTAGHHMPPGEYTVLSVTDTGSGMEREILERAFDPFFTTKPEGKGTGLGLSTAYGIVKQSGGYVWLYSEPGHGTQVKVYLPHTDQEGAVYRGKQASSNREIESRGETILVIEDFPQVQRAVRRTLERYGYTVLVAGGGEEALDIIERDGERIDLILTDIVLEDARGPEVVKSFSKRWPDIRVLFMSGYSGSGDDAPLPPEAPFIGKPFSSDALAAAVREALDRAPWTSEGSAKEDS